MTEVAAQRGGLRLPELSLPAALAGLTIYLGFQAGGYFANTTGWATAALAVALGLRALAVGRPPRGLTWPLAWAAGALALFGVWTLLSAAWSHAPAKALIEFDRVLLYLAVLLLFGTAAKPEPTLRRLPAAFLLAAVVLCGAGLFARTLPHAWPFSLPSPNGRMSWPLSYENALGALAALGITFGLHLASWRREHPIMRVLAVASLPVLAPALILTFSRGGALAVGIGLSSYLLLCRSRGAFAAVLAAAPFAYLSARTAYDAKALATVHLMSPAALSQGRDLALTICASAAGAAALMVTLLRLESRLPIKRPPRRREGRRALRIGLSAATVAAAVTVAFLSGGAGDLYRTVVANAPTGDQQLVRSRLTDLSSRGQNRPKYWHVSLEAFRAHPLSGTGAGTFGQQWDRHRSISEETTEGHSIYLETLGELGAIGAAILLVLIGTTLWPVVARLGTERRALYAAVTAAALAWLVHAGIDWDWEMPALTVWLFAMAGCALAASSTRMGSSRPTRWLWRVGIAAACGLAAMTPASMAISQDKLNASVRALEAGDCNRAEESALASISAAPSRPQGYSFIAYCESRAGHHTRAIAWMDAARRRDPGAWQYLYGLALVRGAAGKDPRAAARTAYELSPLDPVTSGAVKAFEGARPRRWPSVALAQPLPIVVSARGPGTPMR